MATPSSPAPARSPEEPSRWVHEGWEEPTESQMAGGVGVCASSASCQSCAPAISSWVLLRQDSLSPSSARVSGPGGTGAQSLGGGRGIQALCASSGPLPQALPALGSGETGRAPPLPVLSPGAQERWRSLRAGCENATGARLKDEWENE